MWYGIISSKKPNISKNYLKKSLIATAHIREKIKIYGNWLKEDLSGGKPGNSTTIEIGYKNICIQKT